MCYYDAVRWPCGWWKWGSFRAQCNKEYRTGETCGLKLVYETSWMTVPCKMCENMNKKHRRVQKFTDDIARWSSEGGRSNSIDIAQGEMNQAVLQYNNMLNEHNQRAGQVV